MSMMKQGVFLILIFVFLALLQTSFLAHFPLQGFVIPVVIAGVFVASVFAKAPFAGFLGAFVGGLVLDIFSQHFFGYWAVVLVLMFCIVSFLIHTYVRFPFLKRN
jgi:rod shape-determining protein MreD